MFQLKKTPFQFAWLGPLLAPLHLFLIDWHDTVYMNLSFITRENDENIYNQPHFSLGASETLLFSFYIVLCSRFLVCQVKERRRQVSKKKTGLKVLLNKKDSMPNKQNY